MVRKNLAHGLVRQAELAAAGRHNPVNGRRLVGAVPPRALPRVGMTSGRGATLGAKGGRRALHGTPACTAPWALASRVRACPLCARFTTHQQTTQRSGSTAATTWYCSMDSSVRRATVVMVSRDLNGNRPYAVSPAGLHSTQAAAL